LGGGSQIVAVGAQLYVLAGGNVTPVYDGLVGVDAGSMPFFPSPADVFDIAASIAALAFTQAVDAGVLSVNTCMPGGCPASSIEEAQIASDSGMIPQIFVAVNDSTVYWNDPDKQTIRSCPVSGCTGTESPLVTGVNVTSLFVDATGLYWSAGSPVDTYSVTKAALDGGSPKNVGGSGAQIGQVVANSKCIYWSTHGNIGANTLGSVWAAPQP
jgi:hypothetical protein